MEKRPPSMYENLPKTQSFTRSVGGSIKKEKSNRKSKSSKMAIQAFHCSKKEFKRGQVDTRSFSDKFIYSAPLFQNANFERGQITATSRLLDSVNRSAGRILAHSSSSQEKTIPGIQVQRTELAVQGNALWPKYCTKDVHQSDDSCHKGTSKFRNLVSDLPGRFTNHCSYKRRMSPSSPTGTSSPEQIRSTSERKEIKDDSSTNLRMAGNTLESSKSYSTSFTREDKSVSGRTKESGNSSYLLKERSDENSRTSKLDRTMRSSSKASLINHKNYSQNVQEKASRFNIKNSNEFKDTSLQMDLQPNSSSTTRVSYSTLNYTNRCFSRRMGLSKKQDKFPRRIRQFNGLLNKYFGTSNSVVLPSNNIGKKLHYTDSVRQFDSCCSSKESRFNRILPVFTGRIDMEESSSIQLEPQSSTHQRKLQHLSRSAVKKHPIINRMVTKLPSISRKNSQFKQISTSGSICYSPEQEVRNICLPMSRRQSGSSRCSVNILGEMGSPLSLSSNTPDFEGFVETNENFIQERYSNYSRIAIETMVHGSPTSQNSVKTTGSSTGTNGSGQNSNSPTNLKTSRLDVIKKVYQSRFPDCQRAIDLLAAPLRKSSINEYERKWFCFCKFLQKDAISVKDITMANVLKFFDYLFFERNLKPGTISHYRTALTIPLKLKCGIDLHDSAFSALIKAMYIQRPNIPVAAPTWSLDKVLMGLDQLEGNLSLESSLQKTAFLLLLATGWRISELHACVRDKEYCFISSENILRIRPHPSFIAKNEDLKNRWTHKVIKSLKLSDGSISRLCPVKSIQDYLWKSPRITKGKLFLHPSTQKPLTILQLSTYICKLILASNPDAKVKVHDIRKYSASYSLIETMDISEVVSSIGWKSPYTFWKFYMAQTEPLSLQVVLPGVNSSEFVTQDSSSIPNRKEVIQEC